MYTTPLLLKAELLCKYKLTLNLWTSMPGEKHSFTSILFEYVLVCVWCCFHLYLHTGYVIMGTHMCVYMSVHTCGSPGSTSSGFSQSLFIFLFFKTRPFINPNLIDSARMAVQWVQGSTCLFSHLLTVGIISICFHIWSSCGDWGSNL